MKKKTRKQLKKVECELVDLYWTLGGEKTRQGRNIEYALQRVQIALYFKKGKH